MGLDNLMKDVNAYLDRKAAIEQKDKDRSFNLMTMYLQHDLNQETLKTQQEYETKQKNYAIAYDVYLKKQEDITNLHNTISKNYPSQTEYITTIGQDYLKEREEKNIADIEDLTNINVSLGKELKALKLYQGQLHQGIADLATFLPDFAGEEKVLTSDEMKNLTDFLVASEDPEYDIYDQTTAGLERAYKALEPWQKSPGEELRLQTHLKAEKKNIAAKTFASLKIRFQSEETSDDALEALVANLELSDADKQIVQQKVVQLMELEDPEAFYDHINHPRMVYIKQGLLDMQPYLINDLEKSIESIKRVEGGLIPDIRSEDELTKRWATPYNKFVETIGTGTTEVDKEKAFDEYNKIMATLPLDQDKQYFFSAIEQKFGGQDLGYEFEQHLEDRGVITKDAASVVSKSEVVLDQYKDEKGNVDEKLIFDALQSLELTRPEMVDIVGELDAGTMHSLWYKDETAAQQYQPEGGGIFSPKGTYWKAFFESLEDSYGDILQAEGARTPWLSKKMPYQQNIPRLIQENYPNYYDAAIEAARTAGQDAQELGIKDVIKEAKHKKTGKSDSYWDLIRLLQEIDRRK